MKASPLRRIIALAMSARLSDAPQYMEPVQDRAQDYQIIPTEVRATD